MSTVITSIDHRSPAERAGVRTGERLVSIGGHAVEDVLDYRFFGYDRDPELVLESPDGSRRTVRVKKPEAAELGLNFETYLMDEPRPCSNHCLFCFVDQMAPGCRDTLYFKDDDARLPFMTMPACPNRRMASRLSPPALLPSRMLRSLGSVAWTETLMGLMRRSMIRWTSRGERLVRVI